MNTNSSRFDRLVARYYPAVYSFAARLTDDPREAIALTRHAFNSARKQAQNLRNQTAIAIFLISAVIRAGLASARSELRISNLCVAASAPQRAVCVLKNCIRPYSSISRFGHDQALVGQRRTSARN